VVSFIEPVQFPQVPVASSRPRRAVWRLHERREERFRPRIPALPESRLDLIRATYDSVPPDLRAVLDVGGGAGRWRSLLGNPEDYTTVDVAPPAAGNDTYVVADAAALPFRDDVFGLVLMMEVLHLLPEPARALSEAARVLAPGGALILSTRQSWRTLATFDYYRFTRHGLEHLLRAAGLPHLELVPLGGAASVAAVALESNLPLLTKPIVKQLVAHPLWRLAAYLDRTVFRSNRDGETPEASGWLAIARFESRPTSVRK
jgi:SAM-dependent methyltransferase